MTEASAPETDLDRLVGEWLTLPDLADLLGTDVGRVRRLMQEQRFVAVRRGERPVLSVPAAFVQQDGDGAPQLIPSLQGTLVLLADAGFDEAGAIRWLFTPDETLESLGTGPVRPRTPVQALAGGHKTEVRRRAQAEAL